MALTNAEKRNAEKNRKYWADRETEQLKHNITEEAEYDREIQRIYQNMLDRCQKEIDSFYGKYATAEGISIAEAKKRVSKADIAAFERKAKQYVKDKDFSQKANEEMRLYNATMRINRLEMLKANIGLETIVGHDELEKFMAGILKGRTEDELKRQAGILGKTVKNNAAKAHAIVNGSFHSGTFSDRIWQYQDLMRQDLGKLLQQGLIQGKGARAITKDLRKYLVGEKQGKGATYNVERLMRTELARVQTEAQKQSFIRNGFTMYTFICNENPSRHGTCSLCRSLNGKHFKVEDMMPGENAPPLHPHCRCSTSAYEDDEEYEAWMDFLEQGGTTEEWNAQKAAAQKGSAADFIWGEAEGTEKAVIKEIEGFHNELCRKYGVDMAIVGDKLADAQADWDLAVKWNAQEYMKEHPKVSQKQAESIVKRTKMPPRPTMADISVMEAGQYWHDTTSIVEKDGVYSLKPIKKIIVNQHSMDFALSMKEAEESMQRQFEKIERRREKGRGRLYVSNATDGGAGTYLHEFGHAIDFNKGIAQNPKFRKWYDTLSEDEVTNGLSSYASENVNEFIAEAFAESFFSYQRPMSKKFMSILDEIMEDEKK